MKRRAFLGHLARGSLVAAAPAWGKGSVSGTNDRVRVGVIGCGGRGRYVARQLQGAGAEIVALCDVYAANLRAAHGEFGGTCRCFSDFRKLLDQRDVDAVLIATPDHWHAIPTVLACFVLSYEACALNAHGVGGCTPGRSYYLAQGAEDRPHGLAFYGTEGTLFADRLGFEVYPERAPDASSPPPGSQDLRVNRKEWTGRHASDRHARDFLECVRTRRAPAADVQMGHLASNACHLGNIAYRTGHKLRWDAAREQILDDPPAQALLGRQARKPWDVIQ